MKPFPGLVSLVLAPLLGALRALRRWLSVDGPPAGAALVPIRIQGQRPVPRLPAPQRHRGRD
jgi:hypothetical protein